MTYNYSIKPPENCAKAVGIALPISPKISREVLEMIRKKSVDIAIEMLIEVSQEKRAVPYKRAFKDIGHRKGNMTSGRFPQKTAKHILTIIKSAKANAENIGLNTKELTIIHASAQQGPKTMRGGRRFRTAKRTHIEVVVREERKVPKKKGTKVKIQEKKPLAAVEKPTVEKKSTSAPTATSEKPSAEQKPTASSHCFRTLLCRSMNNGKLLCIKANVFCICFC